MADHSIYHMYQILNLRWTQWETDFPSRIFRFMTLVLLGMAMGHLLELNDSHLRGFISLHTPSPCHLGQQAHRLSS